MYHEISEDRFLFLIFKLLSFTCNTFSFNQSFRNLFRNLYVYLHFLHNIMYITIVFMCVLIPIFVNYKCFKFSILSTSYLIQSKARALQVDISYQRISNKKYAFKDFLLYHSWNVSTILKFQYFYNLRIRYSAKMLLTLTQIVTV